MSKATAERALMERLEVWASSLGDGGIKRVDGARFYPTRSMPKLRKAHDEGRLLHVMTEWLPTYRHSSSSAAAQRMADIVKAGLVPWEALLLRRDEPWSKEVSDQQRMKLCEVLRDTYADARREYEARVNARKLLKRA
jgi:hypothetical protein